MGNTTPSLCGTLLSYTVPYWASPNLLSFATPTQNLNQENTFDLVSNDNEHKVETEDQFLLNTIGLNRWALHLSNFKIVVYFSLKNISDEISTKSY